MAIAIYFVGCALVLVGLARLAARARRRGIGGGALMSPLDELYHPIGYEARQETQARAGQMQPLPSPDGEPDPGRWLSPDR